MSNEDSTDPSRPDLTRLEDLSDFLHEDDTEVDKQLEPSFNDNNSGAELSTLDQLDENDLSQIEEEEEIAPPEFSVPNDTEELEGDGLTTSQGEDSFSLSSEFTQGNSDELSSELSDEFTSEISSDLTADESSFSDFPATENDNDSEGLFENSFSSEMAVNEDQQADLSTDDLSTTEPVTDSTNDDTLFTENDSERGEEESYQNDLKESPVLDTNIDNNFLEDSSVESILPAPSEEAIKTPITPATENFSEVKSFANNITYGAIKAGGNPAFAIILSGIKFREDAEDILIILREHDLVTNENEALMKQGLDNGRLLISQISEFAAIFLAHKFRRFNLDIQMGLSEQIHPSKHYKNDQIGLVSKSNVFQNKTESVVIEDTIVKLEDIILSTTPTLESYNILKYLDIINEQTIINEDQIKYSRPFSGESDPKQYHDFGHREDGKVILEDKIRDDFNLDLSEVYTYFYESLKQKCLRLGGNAIVNINFQLTPFTQESSDNTVGKFKLFCSGNVVLVSGSARDQK